MSTDDQNKYDPNVIIQAAQDKLSQNDLEGGQMIYQSALLTWVDDARESANDYDTMQQAVVTLWLAYAEFLASAHQYKSAMDAYAQAVSCPVAGSAGTVWLSYAQFAQEREKKRTAQQVYIRALVGTTGSDGAVQDEQERDILWQAFLEMMQMSNPDLTLAELQEVVVAEQKQQQSTSQQSGQKISPSNSGILGGIGPDSSDDVDDDAKAMSGDAEPASKRVKLGSPGGDDSASPQMQKIHSVSLEAVQADANAFLEALKQNDLPPDILAAWMIRDGQGLAQAPEPLFMPAPPKLADPTAKDILGSVETALKLNQRLQSPSGTLVLKICEAMWTLTALTEHHTSETITQLDDSLKQANEQREANFSHRIATATSELVASAIKTNIDQDRQAFHKACQDQRQKLLTDVAWQLRRLLCAQQQILTQLEIPGFHGPTVDSSSLDHQTKVCRYLHAAFFLRNRIGPEPHLALLAAQAKRLEQQLNEQPLQPPRGSSPFPPSGGPPMQPYPQYGGPPQQPQQQQQQQQQPQQGYGLPPPPPPPVVPNYPAYVPQQQQRGMMHQPQGMQQPQMHGLPPQQQQQQQQQPNPYNQGGPPFNYYPV